MEKNQNLLTIIFVLVIGLIGGYMLAQHVGHAGESHKKMHEAQSPKNDSHAEDTHRMDGGVGAEVEVP